MIRNVVIDCDGVLTSGKQYVDHTGEKFFKDFNSRDIRAIRELVSLGIDVVVMSADDWPGTAAWCNRVGCRFICTRDKLFECVDMGFLPDETLVLGDDAWDVRALKWAKYKTCPMVSDYSVRDIPGMVQLPEYPGGGVIAVLVRYMFEERLV